MSLSILFLGTGTSAGIPMIGCDCSVCRSTDPRDRRDRPSVLIRHPQPTKPGDETDEERPLVQSLIDTAPELRQQMIRHSIHYLDAVYYTHNHADHVFGIDDLRRFNAVMGRPLDLFAEMTTIEWFRRSFPYIFDSQNNINRSFVPELIPAPIEPGVRIHRMGAVWTPLRLLHGRLPVLGFRIDWEDESIAYCTDVSAIPPETYPLLEGLDVLVLDGLRYRHHPTHLTIDQALDQIDRIQPGHAFLTHMAHDVQHAELAARLPAGIAPAYDGLEVSVQQLRSGVLPSEPITEG
ncbi:MAG: MBL fold metallo-hydrolase [Phycisphaeraceae bacterium]|nr:MBL fold metallo-hydrolase [Phycisphaeraceae bacterium]